MKCYKIYKSSRFHPKECSDCGLLVCDRLLRSLDSLQVIIFLTLETLQTLWHAVNFLHAPLHCLYNIFPTTVQPCTEVRVGTGTLPN
jgi:hypothetical protein